MCYPYCTVHYLGDPVEVVYKLDQDGKLVVHFEQPDAELCFRSADIEVPEGNVSNVAGFSGEDIECLEDFVECNLLLIMANAVKNLGYDAERFMYDA